MNCAPLATTTPLKQLPFDQYSTKSVRTWNQVSGESFAAHMDLAGRKVVMNRDQYETYMIIAGFLSWLLIATILMLFWIFAPRDHRDNMIRIFRKFDMVPRRHEVESKHEDHSEVSYAPSALGGVVSIGLVLLGLITTGLLFFNYVQHNVVVQSTLDVYNATVLQDVAVDMDVAVTFVGYSGCVGDTFFPATVGETNTVPEIYAKGVTYGSMSSSYSCSGGGLNMALKLRGVRVETDPKFFFSIESGCAPCTVSTDTIKPARPGNKKWTCPSCSVSSAQAITYSVKANNNFPAVKDLHGRDKNFVSGSVAPESPLEALRGDTPTEVKIMLTPADYENHRTAKEFHSYRLLYSDSIIGSTQGFRGASSKQYGNTDFSGVGQHGVTAAPDYRQWIKDDTWAKAGAPNAVKFLLHLPLAPNRVRIVVDQRQTFLDLWGAVGGVLSLLATIFFLSMSYAERSNDRNDPIGGIYGTLKGWYDGYKQQLMEKWYPEPESWAMENISRMQRKEEKREGGARTNEDVAVTNFKDLYSRNAITATALKAKEEQDFGAEIDDYHGQL